MGEELSSESDAPYIMDGAVLLGGIMYAECVYCVCVYWCTIFIFIFLYCTCLKTVHYTNIFVKYHHWMFIGVWFFFLINVSIFVCFHVVIVVDVVGCRFFFFGKNICGINQWLTKALKSIHRMLYLILPHNLLQV